MRAVSRTDTQQLLLGEWACLGILYQARTHGFAIAARLKPSGDVGRVWSLSRPLTYRSLEQLSARSYIHAVGEEKGLAGGNRTILAATRTGRAQFRKWLHTPVAHLRDVRSELLAQADPGRCLRDRRGGHARVSNVATSPKSPTRWQPEPPATVPPTSSRSGVASHRRPRFDSSPDCPRPTPVLRDGKRTTILSA